MWIDDIISRINATISAAPCASACTTYGLTKIIQRSDKSFPAFLQGTEWREISLDDRKGIQIYHRQVEYNQTLSEFGTGHELEYNFTLRMRLFGIGIKPVSCKDSNSALAMQFQSSLPNYPATATGLMNLTLRVESLNEDFESVFSDEFPDAELGKYITRAAAFSVDYTITGILCGDPCAVVIA